MIPTPVQTGAKQVHLLPPASTYLSGLEALRRSYSEGECPNHPTIIVGKETFPRPFTFGEDLLARVTGYNTIKNEEGSTQTLPERLSLFNTWLDSCTAVVDDPNSAKFKIVPLCPELVAMNTPFPNFSQAHSTSRYYRSLNVPEFDSDEDIYNQPLTRSQFLLHPAWKEAAGGDTALLRDYAAIIYNHLSKLEIALVFRVRTGSRRNEAVAGSAHRVRALYLASLGGGSDAVGDVMNCGGSFLMRL